MWTWILISLSKVGRFFLILSSINFPWIFLSTYSPFKTNNIFVPFKSISQISYNRCLSFFYFFFVFFFSGVYFPASIFKVINSFLCDQFHTVKNSDALLNYYQGTFSTLAVSMSIAFSTLWYLFWRSFIYIQSLY